ncbi:hypothetical protein K491DRAFT_694183 [Lophiostoma macrostomum CBS 122681]|uniref:YMC020W-like alpha/beta hydrolase domain-containing protein n=1 Tax=Lophiostoma macrostomum CBS 122681 TaxID=1314788 RepID=A0A6A6T604_9PLEO|nr:hypothetical protein K491DRAFT_694183 [Lophiostoma macrostomum CBS 122681]
MSPRKKSKPNPEALAASAGTGPESSESANTASSPPGPAREEDSAAVESTASSKSVAESAASSESTTAPSASASTTQQELKKKPSRKWLGGSGSWRSKAPAVVKTAKESIGVGVAGGATAELPGERVDKGKEQSPKKFLTKRKSSKGNALPASMTKLNVSSDGPIDQGSKAEPPVPTQADETSEPPPAINEPPLPPEPVKKDQVTEPTSTFGWRSWWSRPDGYSEAAKDQGSGVKDTDDARSTPLPGATPSEEADAKIKELGSSDKPIDLTADQDTEMKDAPEVVAGQDQDQDKDTEMKDAPISSTEGTRNVSNTSWFWLWSSAQNAQTNQPPPASVPAATEDAASKPDAHQDAPAEASLDTSREGEHDARVEPAADIPDAPQEDAVAAAAPSKPSGWAFFFRAQPKNADQSSDSAAHKQVGELAVSGSPSQSHPEAAQFNEQEQPREEPVKEPVKESVKPVEESVAKRSFRSLRGRPKAKGAKDTPTDTPMSSKTVTPSQVSPSHSPTRPDTAPAAQPTPKVIRAKEEPANLLLPEFRNTYSFVQKPTYWQLIRQYFLGDEAPMPHLHINPAPPRIKKAVAIGVHGFFPAPIFQRVLGQPTGTSIRFATAAKRAIEDYASAQGYSPEIEQIALEGEGFVAERVNTLWKLLLNWIDQIKAADFILVACHSQGVPVAIMLVAKLIQFGCVNAARIGVCAMAGVNLGPFKEYKTKYFGPTAAELFEFSDPKSLVSQMYLAALDEVLRYGTRILYVGSIDDQLVSLESSTFSTLSHPYIYRAVFVDGRIHAPDFLTHLVGFTLKLRNLGLPDHGLIRELSPALAGSLYAGQGHSTVYEDPRVYDLAVQHALETTSLPINPAQQRPSTSASFKGINIPVPGAKFDEKDIYALRVKDYESVGSGNQNPYFLPWAMRGLLEEEFVKRELGSEVEELLALFEEWRPTGKLLKDVKFRLEAVRSKL